MAHVEDKSHSQAVPGHHSHHSHGHGHGHGDPNQLKQVTVEVNSKPVVLDETVMTGAEIKQAAIAQQVQIQPDFVLQLEQSNGEWDPIGDNQEVHVKQHMNFHCIAPDDNS